MEDGYIELALGQLKDVNIGHFVKTSIEIRVYKYRFHIIALIFTNRSFSHKTSKQQLKNNNKVCQYLCQPYLKDP